MQTHTYHVKIGEGRRVVLPAEVCRAMSLGIGDTVILRVENDRASLSSVEKTIARFQSMLASRTPAGYSAIDELISEREDASLSE